MEQDKILELLKSKGFDSLDDLPKVFDALESAKTDIGKHKTRASKVTDLETELQTLREAQQAREDSEKTELQKLTDRIAKQEQELAAANAATAKANRTVLLEKGIAEHISGVDEKLRPLAQNYMRTVLPGKEWADSEALKAQIAETLNGFNELLPEEMKVVETGGNPPPRTQDGIPLAGDKPVFDFNAALHPEG